MAFNIGSLTAAQQIQLIYTAYFGRAAEPDGFNFWTPLLQENLNGSTDGNPGVSLSVIADQFFNQAETRAVYDLDEGVTSTTDLPSPFLFLNDVYQNLFGRVPEPDGVLFWGNVLDSGTFTIGEVILKIVEGAQAADQAALENRIEAGLDWKDSADAAGVDEVDPVNPDPNYDAAVNALDGVTDDPQTLADAKTATDAFFNTAPTLAAGSDDVQEDGPAVAVDLSALGDDVDAEDDGSTLTYTITGAPSEGSASITGTTLSFDPDGDFEDLAEGETRDVTVTVTATDTHGETAENTVTITVTGQNDAPTLAAFVAPVGAVEDGPSVDVNLSALGADVDSDDDGNTLTFTVTGAPSEGTATITGGATPTSAATLTFAPGSDFQDLNDGDTRDVTVQVTAEDAHGATVTQDYTITVTGTNDAPTLAAGSGAAVEDGPSVTVDLAALGDDADGENDGTTLTYSVTGAPSEGSASIAGTTLTFDPDGDFEDLAKDETRDVTVQVTATDAQGATAVNDVTITVTGQNDDPTLAAVVTPLTAVEDGPSVDVDLSALGADIDSDDDGSTLTYSVTDAPAEGSASITGGTATADGTTLTFDPGADFQDLNDGDTRDVTVQVTAEDAHGATVTQDYTITVTGTNDAPTLAAGSGAAVEDGPSVTVELAALGDDADGENDGTTLTYSVTGAPSEGSASIAGTTLTFDPGSDFQDLAAGETRDVTVQVTATDAQGATAVNDVTITVTGENDAPVAQDLTLTGTIPSGLLVATDADTSDTLTFAVDTPPTEGTVTVSADGSFVYAPDAGFDGTDSFDYTVSDGNGGTDTATVTIDLDPTTGLLTSTNDSIEGTSANDIIRGNENTLNAGDVINGNGGNDTLIINVNNPDSSTINFAGFEANVETFQTTADGSGGVSFDLSSSEITGNTLINTNSTVDVAFLFANMIADTDGDGRPQIDVDVLNPTDNAGTRVDVRDSDVTGSTDEINLTVTSSDDDDNDSGPIVLDEGLEHLDLFTTGSPEGSTVAIDAIITNPGAEPDGGANTRGIQTVNIDTAVTLTVGDTMGGTAVTNIFQTTVDTPQTDTPGGTVPTPDPFNPIEGGQNEGNGSLNVGHAGSAGLSGFENSFGSGPASTFPGLGTPEAPRVSNIDGSSSTGQINLSTFASTNGVTIDGGSNNDRLQGSNGQGDLIRGNAGDDVIDGGSGSGSVDGNDTLLGGDGFDVIFGHGGDDSIRGGNDDDQIAGGDGDDRLFGDDGDDIIDMGTTAGGTTDGANFVDGGLGDDIIIGDAEVLIGRSDKDASLVGIDQVNGGDGTDSFFILGDNVSGPGSINGLNDVQQVENFIFQNGGRGTVTQTYDLGTGATPTGDTVITNTYNANIGGDILFDGSDDDVILNINASPFTRGATFIGSDQNNTFTGGSGDDTFLPDSDFSGAPSGDVINAGGGNDDILVGAGQLVTGGGLSIDGQGGTDRIIVQEGFRAPNAAIDGNYTGVEQLVVEDTNDTGGVDFDLSIDGGFTNGGQTLTVDGRGMDAAEDLGVDARNAAVGTNLNLLGGLGDDFFDMGQNLDGNVTIDGGGDNLSVNLETLGAGGGGIGVSNGDQVQVNFDGITIGDSAFNNVSNTEVVKLESDGTPGVGTLNLGSAAVAAGVQIVDASALDAPGYDGSTIDASGFADDITIIDGDADLNILTDGADTVVLAGGTDNVQTGIDDDQLLISGTDLDDSDSVDMGTGTDKIVMQDEQGDVNAEIDLDTQFGFETIEFQGDGNVGGGGFETNSHSLTFQDGGVGTYTSVTEVTVDGRNNTDPLDNFTITLEGAGGDNGSPNQTGDGTVTSNLALNIFGIAGTDTLIKHNFGQNNKIDAELLGGDDILRARASDVGDMTVDGGTDTGVATTNIIPAGPQGDVFDIIANGAFVDDDAINLSNFETLTSTTTVPGPTMPRLVGTMGAEFNEAGFQHLVGGTGNDDVTVNGDFTGVLGVEIDSGGDDRIDASGSTTALRIVSNYGAIDAADTILGGTTMDDKIVLYDAFGAGTTDLSGMSGVETIEVNEVSSGGSTILLGTGGTTPLNIVHPSPSGGNPFDSGETLSIDGSTYGAAVNFTNNGGSGPALTMTTNAGADSIDSGGSNDVLMTQAGNDTVDAGDGHDFVNAGADDDSVDGGTGNDTLEGGTGDDTVNGGSGDDLITGGQGEDNLTGGAGADDFRYVQVSDSQGLLNDVITDFASGTDRILVEENVLVQAGGGATSVAPVTGINAPSFGQASGTISDTENDGVADWVFQAADGGDPATLWIDTNDDGFITGLDLQIQMDNVTAMQAGDVVLIDTIGPDAATIDSITTDTAGPTGTTSDFITNDDGTDGTAPVIEIGLPGGTDGTGAKAGDTVNLTLSVALPANSTIGATAAAAAGTSVNYTLTAADIANGFVNLNLGDGAAGIGDYTTNLEVTVTDPTGTDQDGNATGPQVSDAVNQDIVIDVTAPTIAIDSPLEGDDVVNAAEDQDVVISGTTTGVEDGQLVSISINGGTAITTAVTSNTWSLAAQDLSGVADGVGAISITADVSDLAGNPAPQATATLDKDTLASVSITGLGSEPTTDDDIIAGSEDSAGGWTVTGTVANVENGQTVTVEILDDTNSVVHTFAGVAVAGGAFTTAGAPANLFSADGTYTARATVDDVAGNSATDDFAFAVDETGPVLNITSVTWDSSGDGTWTVNGSFDVADLNASIFDNTELYVGDPASSGLLLNASTITTITATQIVLDMNGTNNTGLGNFWGFPDGQSSPGETDTAGFGVGLFTDGVGNTNAEVFPVPIQFDVQTSVVKAWTDAGKTTQAPIVGQGLDDTFELDDVGGFNQVTGGGGADTFHIDNLYDGTDPSSVIATITDFDLNEGDLIQLDASDVNDEITGSPYSSGDDGAAVAFSTFLSGVSTAATNIEGTLIYDAVNETLRIDYNGDTSWDGANLTDTSDDDDIIDLSGIANGPLTASDIDFLS